ncbi:hypothetical protein [Pseudomonas sp.]|uniref:hypothetical protein n=1 Tax=Pseudomonas sp. TaxID=306 RepID=UPI003F370C26
MWPTTLAQTIFNFRGLLIIVSSMLVLAATATPAQADLPRLFVQPGSTIVLEQGTEKIGIVGTAPSGARVLTTESGTPQAYWILTYTASNPPPADSEVPIVFTQGNSSKTSLVEITNTPTAQDPALIGKTTRLLFAMLVMAVILESAFAVLFNWRVFLEFFDGRGVRTVVMFLAAYLVVRSFNIDFIADLMNIYLSEVTSSFETRFLTALVLAGGSASVNSLMVALNLRQNRQAENVTPKPPKTKAWVALKVHRERAKKIVEIMQQTRPINPGSTPQQLLGLVRQQNVFRRLAKYFWRDVERVPMTAGIEVDPNIEYTFVIRGVDSKGDAIYCDASGRSLSNANGVYTPAPRSYVFAPGTIVDFEVTL